MTLLVVATHAVWDTNHYFELNPALRGSKVRPGPFLPVELDKALDGWNFPAGADGRRTLVVVAAEGGGIQAAAWTAQVLTGLDELFVGFGDSVALVSGVSGGSVGLLYYLQQRPARSNDPAHPSAIAPDMRDKICDAAAASSLEATAWGMAFPDLMRMIFPPAVSDTYDRGWAIEFDWRKRLGSHNVPDDTRLNDWAERVRDKEMPIPVFNASIADTGDSLIMSPVIESWGFGLQQEFVRLYQPFEPNPRISTLARLSATFSYVSPICKPLSTGLDPQALKTNGYHLNHRIADGGYVDNSGLLTATRWTKRLITVNTSATRPFDRVLLLRVIPFDADPLEPTTTRLQSDRSGLLWEAFGPILTLNSARGGSQFARGEWEMNLIANAFAGLPVYSVKLYPKHRHSEVIAPLSWKLTPLEKQAIRSAWAQRAGEMRMGAQGPLPASGLIDPPDLESLFRRR